MKKLLSLLSVLTISGTSISTAMSTNLYQKQEEIIKNSDINHKQTTDNLEDLKRNKRFSNYENTLSSTYWKTYAVFNPELWQEIILIKKTSYDIEEFKIKVKNKMDYSYYNKKNLYIWDSGVSYYYLDKFSETLWDNWNKIIFRWNVSNKKNPIRIITSRSEMNKLYQVNIVTNDKNEIENERKNINWITDNKIRFLNVIENKEDNTIFNAIKKNNPELDISQLKILEKDSSSFLQNIFSIKVGIKENSNKYPSSIDTLFFFVTKDFLNSDLMIYLKNEILLKEWSDNFVDWLNEVRRQQEEDISQYGNNKEGNAFKRIWKGNKITEFNNNLLSLLSIFEIIHNNLKIENLKNEVNDIKKDILNLNNKIYEIKKDMNNKNKFLEGCTSWGAFTALIVSIFVKAESKIPLLLGLGASSCDIGNFFINLIT